MCCLKLIIVLVVGTENPVFFFKEILFCIFLFLSISISAHYFRAELINSTDTSVKQTFKLEGNNSIQNRFCRVTCQNRYKVIPAFFDCLLDLAAPVVEWSMHLLLWENRHLMHHAAEHAWELHRKLDHYIHFCILSMGASPLQ